MRVPFRRRARGVLAAAEVLEQRRGRRGDQEHLHQAAVVQWSKLMAIAMYPELDLLFAIPSGGFRMLRTAGRLFAEGVRSGVPDLCLPVARHGYHGLFLEMKAPTKTARLSELQRGWIAKLAGEGYCVSVAYGVDVAQAALQWYVNEDRGADPLVLQHHGLDTGHGTAIEVTQLNANGGAFCWRPARMT